MSRGCVAQLAGRKPRSDAEYVLRRARPALIAFALLVAVPLATAASASAQSSAGTVRFAKAAEASFDAFTSSPSVEQQAWMRAHYTRMRAYAPYFDSRLGWFPNAWAYQDAYAAYRGQALASQHPDWILKDAQGNKLY